MTSMFEHIFSPYRERKLDFGGYAYEKVILKTGIGQFRMGECIELIEFDPDQGMVWFYNTENKLIGEFSVKCQLEIIDVNPVDQIDNSSS